MENKQKIKELKEKLKMYEEKLAQAMIGYGGVRHESAVSEIKHSKVMVLRAMIEGLKEEIAMLEKEMGKSSSS
jgi:hypothetical protein